jgi:hypothetical protein
MAGENVVAVGVGGHTSAVTVGTGEARKAWASAAIVGREITATKIHSAKAQNATKNTTTRIMELPGESSLLSFTGEQYSTGDLTFNSNRVN